MDRARFDELKEAYVLGALSENERRELEGYLTLHPELRPEIEELGYLARALALSPTEYEPPPELRENILRVVEAEASGTPRADGETAARGSAWASLRERLSLQKLALGAATVLAVALLAWNVLLQGEVQSLQGEVQGLQGQLQQRETFAMQGSGNASNAEARVVEVEGQRAVIVAENMPRIPEGKTMQIWVIQNGTPQPAGTFRPGDDTVAAPITNSLDKAEAVAITVEPSGGSDQPTSEPVLQAGVQT